jgi:hypothetical protein
MAVRMTTMALGMVSSEQGGATISLPNSAAQRGMAKDKAAGQTFQTRTKTGFDTLRDTLVVSAARYPKSV